MNYINNNNCVIDSYLAYQLVDKLDHQLALKIYKLAYNKGQINPQLISRLFQKASDANDTQLIKAAYNQAYQLGMLDPVVINHYIKLMASHNDFGEANRFFQQNQKGACQS